jgi:hypothetical protein
MLMESLVAGGDEETRLFDKGVVSERKIKSCEVSF